MTNLKIVFVLVTNSYLASGVYFSGQNYLVDLFRKRAEFLDLSSIETKWIKQPIDHFNASDTREWNMKYFQNLGNWKPGGPVFLYIQGESTAHPECISNGLTFELAVETNGAMWSTEHRYYGDSQPFNKSTTTAEDLKYLTSKQALADIAKLIKQIKLSPEYASSKVVVIGGSYAGNLAAWMRLLYPDLVDAAIASSAPVQAKVNFYEYLDTVAIDYKTYCTPESYNNLTTTIERIKNLSTTENGMNELKQEFNICNDSDTTKLENKAMFFNDLFIMEMSIVAQYGNPVYIKKYCYNVMNDFFRSYNVSGDCKRYKLFPLKNMEKYWLYQMCTEFGYFNIAPKNHLFSNLRDISFFYKLCSFYGPEFNETRVEEGVNKTNDLYGGLNPGVTNVVFVNGEIDPWHRLGIVKNLSDTVPAIVIPGASHCNDLVDHGLYEVPEAVLQARKLEKHYIKQWINYTNNYGINYA